MTYNKGMTLTTETPAIDRNEAIASIRKSLKARTGRTWSVTGGRGTAWGWITITAPPARRDMYGSMWQEDCAVLAAALGLDFVHDQGVNIPASNAYRVEYCDRAAGRTPSIIATPYWD